MHNNITFTPPSFVGAAEHALNILLSYFIIYVVTRHIIMLLIRVGHLNHYVHTYYYDIVKPGYIIIIMS